MSIMNTNVAVHGAAAVAALLLVLAFSPPTTAARGIAVVDNGGGWDDAHATFYGDETGAETMQGACGYGDLFQQGYGLETAALSEAMFAGGWSCGGCYELQCEGSDYCKPGGSGGGAVKVTVTATNLCPANYSKPNENWCNPPLKHFDLSMPMFLRLVTDYHVGIIPVRFRRVPCAKAGGIRFEMKGNRWWVAVLVYNVAGAGDVRAVAVRGSADGGQWRDMSRSWGQIWHADGDLVGQGLSFRVATSDGRTVVVDDVAPPNWAVGQTFESKVQF